VTSGETSVSALVGALGEVQGMFAIARSRLSAKLGAVESESEFLFGSTIDKWKVGSGDTVDWLSYLEVVTDAGQTHFRWLLDVGRVGDCGWRVVRSLEQNDLPIARLADVTFENTVELSAQLPGVARELLELGPNSEI
jgi:hypothetical protein